MAVWFQAAEIKILADLNLAVALRSIIRHYKHCERIYQGALPSSCLRYLNKAVSSQIYKKYNWQHVNDELAIHTACENYCLKLSNAYTHSTKWLYSWLCCRGGWKLISLIPRPLTPALVHCKSKILVLAHYLVTTIVWLTFL